MDILCQRRILDKIPKEVVVWAFVSEKSNNVDQYEKKLDDMEGNMRTEQRSVAGKEVPAACVSFKSRFSAAIVSDSHGPSRFRDSHVTIHHRCPGPELHQCVLPKRIPELLAVAVPGHASFFVAYVVTSGWTKTFSSEFFQFVLIYYGLGYIIYLIEWLVRNWARLLGPGLNKAGKFPTVVTHQESLESKVNETKATVKFQLKKVFCMGVVVENLDMEEQLFQNI
ncbi:hypothetical protein OROMI_009581 [Orobanche minor]